MFLQRVSYAPKCVLFSGLMNITLSTEAVATKELCGEEIPFVPKQGQKDTIIKLIQVRVSQAVLLLKLQSRLCAIPKFCAC